MLVLGKSSPMQSSNRSSVNANESRIRACTSKGKGVQTSRRVASVAYRQTGIHTQAHIRILGRAHERSPLTHPLIRPFAQMLMIIHATDLLCAARASPSDAAMRRLGKRQEAERREEIERAKMVHARNRE